MVNLPAVLLPWWLRQVVELRPLRLSLGGVTIEVVTYVRASAATSHGRIRFLAEQSRWQSRAATV